MVKQEQDIRLLRQRLAQSNIIVDATRRFAATLNLAEVRQALFEAAFQVVGSQQIALHIYGSAGWQSEVCYPLEGNRVETAVLPPQATTLQIFTQNEPFFWQRNENSGDTLVVVKPVGSFDSYVALPLKGAKKVVGVIEVFNLLTPENAVQQAELLTEITGRLAWQFRMPSFIRKQELPKNSWQNGQPNWKLSPRLACMLPQFWKPRNFCKR